MTEREMRLARRARERTRAAALERDSALQWAVRVERESPTLTDDERRVRLAQTLNDPDRELHARFEARGAALVVVPESREAFDRMVAGATFRVEIATLFTRLLVQNEAGRSVPFEFRGDAWRLAHVPSSVTQDAERRQR